MLSNFPEYELVDNHALLNVQKQITAKGQVLGRTADGQWKLDDTRITLIPYYAWNHRRVGKMDVWLTNDPSKIGR